MRVISPNDPDFVAVDQITSSRRPRFDYDELVSNLQAIARNATADEIGTVVIEYPKNAISNLCNALKRRGLKHLRDYKIIRVPKEDSPTTDRLIIKPLPDFIDEHSAADA